MNSFPEYINIKEMAELLHIGKSMAYKIANSPGFPCVRIGSKYIIDKGELMIWMKDRMGKTVNV